MKSEFLHPRFDDARFAEHTLPLEVARDLAAYETLVVALLKRLARRIDVQSLSTLGLRLCKTHCGPVKLASCDTMRDQLGEASKALGGHKFS
jgi:hypothetical protein